MDGAAKNVSDFRSPLRVLVASFRKSRDRWKQKCIDAKVDRKRLQVRVADVSKSRDGWRDKAARGCCVWDSTNSSVRPSLWPIVCGSSIMWCCLAKASV